MERFNNSFHSDADSAPDEIFVSSRSVEKQPVAYGSFGQSSVDTGASSSTVEDDEEETQSDDSRMRMARKVRGRRCSQTF